MISKRIGTPRKSRRCFDDMITTNPRVQSNNNNN